MKLKLLLFYFITAFFWLCLPYAHAQTLSWQPPERMDKDFKVTGYRIAYEMQPDDSCNVSADFKHYVDVGLTYEYILNEDPNFFPGARYALSIVSYNQYGISEPAKDVKCATIKGQPKVDDGLDVEDDQTNNGGDNEKYYISTSDILLPRANADELRGSSDSTVEPQRTGHERNANDTKPLQTLLGSVRESYFKRRPNRSTVTGNNKRSERTINLQAQYGKPRVGSGPEHMFRDDSGGAQRNDSGRVNKVESSMQGDNVRSTEPTEPSKHRVGIILGLLLSAAILFKLRGRKL